MSEEDVSRGRWRFIAIGGGTLGLGERKAERYLRHYVATLARRGKYELTVWPYHAMLGGIGHALVAAFEEAVFFHTIARAARPISRSRGQPSDRALFRSRPRGARRARTGEPITGRTTFLSPAARVRRGRDRRTGQEPLRRLDDR